LPLLDDAEREMRDILSVDYPCALQFNLLSAQMVEQSDTVTEQNGTRSV
jgi:hypothetical protein